MNKFRSIFFLSIFTLLLISQHALSETIDRKFLLTGDNGLNLLFGDNDSIIEIFQIVATDGKTGILKNIDQENQKYICFGIFNQEKLTNESNGVEKISIYYPHTQTNDPGNCHNYSLNIILSKKSLWKLKLTEQVEVTYEGVRTFGFMQKGFLKRIK